MRKAGRVFMCEQDAARLWNCGLIYNYNQLTYVLRRRRFIKNRQQKNSLQGWAAHPFILYVFGRRLFEEIKKYFLDPGRAFRCGAFPDRPCITKAMQFLEKSEYCFFVNTEVEPPKHPLVLARYAFQSERVPTGIEDVVLLVDAGQWILMSMDRTETWTMAHEAFVDSYMPGAQDGWGYMADVFEAEKQKNEAPQEDNQEEAQEEEQGEALGEARAESVDGPADEEPPTALLVAASGDNYLLSVEYRQEQAGMAVFGLYPEKRLSWGERWRLAWRVLSRGILPDLHLDVDVRLLEEAFEKAPEPRAD